MADLNTTVGFTYSGTGLKQAEADLKRVAQTSKTTVQSMQNTSRAASRLGSAFNRMGPGIQNASFQLQDIIVQMQMGTPVARTLGQQLPQLLGGFGPLGAVLGVVAGASASLIPLLFQIGEGGDEAGKGITTMKDALEDLEERANTSIQLLEALEAGFTSINEKLVAERIQTLEREIAILDRQLAGKTQRQLARGSAAANARREELRAELELRRKQVEAEDKLEQRQKRADALSESRKKGVVGSGSLITGGPSERNKRFFEDTQARVDATRDEIEKRKEIEERWEKYRENAAKKEKREFEKLQREKEREAERAADTIGRSFENAFMSIVDGSKTASMAFKDMANSIISDIARIVVQQSVSKPVGGFLSKALSGFIGGGFSSLPFGGTTGQSFGDYLSYGASAHPSLNAKGGAFSHGIKMFAKGGVVGGPTMFGMQNGMGMMGEAGPEAILPLKRGPGGNLGVEGTPPVVNVNIVNENGGEVETSQNGPNIEVLIKRAVAQDIKGGGTVYGAISKTFNIRPEVTRRA